MGFLFSCNCVKSAHFSSRWTTWALRLEDQVWSEVERLCSLGEAATTSWRPGHFPWVSLSSVSSSTKQSTLVALLRGMKRQCKLRVPVPLQSSVRPCCWVSSWATPACLVWGHSSLHSGAAECAVPSLRLHASKTRDGQGSSAEGQNQPPLSTPVTPFELQLPTASRVLSCSLSLSLSLISTILLPGCHVRDAVYTLHQQPGATCGKGRNARQAGAWLWQETGDWWAWAPLNLSSQKLGWEPVGVPHPTPDIGSSHSFPILSTHTCCCQLILNPLEGARAHTHTHTHTHPHTHPCSWGGHRNLQLLQTHTAWLTGPGTR